MMAYRIANSIHPDRTEVYALLIAMAQMRTAFANLPMPPTGRLRSPMRTSPMLAAPVTQGGVKINRRRALVADSAPDPLLLLLLRGLHPFATAVRSQAMVD